MIFKGKCWEASLGALFLGLSGVLGSEAYADAPDWLVQGQTTVVEQYHPSFNAGYSGSNSLSPEASSRETFDTTLFLGRRLWDGAELWLNPEIDQGFGLGNTLGAAGYVSGEAYKVGDHSPYIRLQRLFVRQHFNLSGEQIEEAEDQNRFSSRHRENEIILTVGRYSVVDLFDGNQYAHDPKEDFLNWSVIDSGAFDYAADPWGYTQGLSAEWIQGNNTLRAGFFQMSDAPNEKIVGVHFGHQMWVIENEVRYHWGERPGAIRLLGYVNDAQMAAYSDALALGTVDLASVRRPAKKAGIGLNAEQALTDHLGMFFRFSQNDGRYETFEFTDINRSTALGLQWSLRAKDHFGLAIARNELSDAAQRFFAAGGLGVLIGDGQLRYAPEWVAESYYSWGVSKDWRLTLDLQQISHPAYNQDRGPVTVLAIRVHGEF